MSICFSLAQMPLRTANMQECALDEFNFNSKDYDLSGDASKGAVWKAGKKGLEPLLYPSLSSKGILFLVQMRFGIYPKYDYDAGQEYKTYEALLNGQRYGIIYKLAWGNAARTSTGWAPFTVMKIREFTEVQKNIGAKVVAASDSSPVAAPGALSAPNAFYSSADSGSSNTAFYATPPKPIVGSSSGSVGKQQPHPVSVSPVFIVPSGI